MMMRLFAMTLISITATVPSHFDFPSESRAACNIAPWEIGGLRSHFRPEFYIPGFFYSRFLTWKFFKKNSTFYLTACADSATTFAMDKNKIFKTGKALLFITSGLLLSDACLAAAPAIPPVGYFQLAADQANPLPVPAAAPARPRTRKAYNHWTKDEDKILKDGVKNTQAGLVPCWTAIARRLNTGRTGHQCRVRYMEQLDPSIKKGDWSAAEDDLLRRLVTTHGEGKWAKIAKGILGKTGKQCRQHWMEVLDPTIKKGSWTKAEDKILKDGVEAGFSWADIARQMGTGKTGKQCRNRWTQTLAPGINKGGWTPAEDQIIITAIQNGNHSWADIARQMGTGKTGKQCRQHWTEVLDPTIKKGSWTAAEDKILKDGVEAGFSWADIARQMGTSRTGLQCRDRWLALKNKIQLAAAPARSRAARVNWSTDEDNLLTQLHEELGNAWTAIARQMNTGRTDQQCRERWEYTLAPGIKKGGWTAKEDQILIDGAVTHGEGKWAKIAEQLPGRIGPQCRERWTVLKNRAQQPQAQALLQTLAALLTAQADQANQTDLPPVPVAAPAMPRAASVFWTEAEDQILKDGFEAGFSWVAIARRMNTGKTDKQCRNRCQVLKNRAPQSPELPAQADQANQTDLLPVPAAAPTRPMAAYVGWTTEEDDLLIQLHGRLGNRWGAIAEEIPGRTDIQCQDHWQVLKNQVPQPPALPPELALLQKQALLQTLALLPAQADQMNQALAALLQVQALPQAQADQSQYDPVSYFRLAADQANQAPANPPLLSIQPVRQTLPPPQPPPALPSFDDDTWSATSYDNSRSGFGDDFGFSFGDNF
jgi:bacterioferritin-associated ferredoxin